MEVRRNKKRWILAKVKSSCWCILKNVFTEAYRESGWSGNMIFVLSDVLITRKVDKMTH